MQVVGLTEHVLNQKPSHILFRYLAEYVARGGHLNWEDRAFFDELCAMRATDESRHQQIVDLILRLEAAGLIDTRMLR